MKGIRIVKLGHSVGDDIVLTADSHWAEWVFISSEQNGGDGYKLLRGNIKTKRFPLNVA